VKLYSPTTSLVLTYPAIIVRAYRDQTILHLEPYAMEHYQIEPGQLV